MSTTESNLIACAVKKLKQIAADAMAGGTHIGGSTSEAIGVVLAEIERLKRGLEFTVLACDQARAERDRLSDSLRPEIERLTRDRDRLIERWPDAIREGPLLYEHTDGTWFLATLDGDEWTYCDSGPYPARDAAVRAAAGLDAMKEGER